MIASPSIAKTSKTLAKLFLFYNSLNKITVLCKVSDWCVLLNLKNYKLLTHDLLRFVSHVLWHAWWHTRWRAWAIGILYRIVDVMISVTKQLEAAEANVCRGGFQNDSEELWVIHWQWRLLSTWCAMLELHLSLRTGSLRSWNDLHISFRETGTAVHMIFRQNFVVPGHWFSPKKVVILWVRAAVVILAQAGCCCCCCWRPDGLLICNS